MPAERRNFYRLLYVQPEAPPEVIKASYRALMSTLRGHPDLGGDPERAALLNAAYAVLSDPQQRREYDKRLRRPLRQATAAPQPDPAAPASGRGRPAPASAAAQAPAPAPAPAPDDRAWLARRCCPFCSQSFTALPKADTRCIRCDSPLMPAPAPDEPRGAGELLGRRRSERYPRDMVVRVRLGHVPGERAARLRDLSFTGLSLHTEFPVPRGTMLQVGAAGFDTVAQVIDCRRAGAGHTLHARLLTLQLRRSVRGVYVDAAA